MADTVSCVNVGWERAAWVCLLQLAEELTLDSACGRELNQRKGILAAFIGL